MVEDTKTDEEDDIKAFGFWIYLMTDLVIFGALFSVFVVLRNNTYGGPSGRELFHLPSAFAQTLILLTSSFTCSLATLSIHQAKKKLTFFWFLVTFLLGISFLYLELSEFKDFILRGYGPQHSAFLSSFFTLVGTHGFHISVGLLWMIVAMVRIWTRKLSPLNISRMFRLAYFWHFLDVVWVFIFTIVYGLSFLL
jgi:cytochrome o ubiquinol oxidase subunit III